MDSESKQETVLAPPMSDATRLALAVLGISLPLGLLGDLLLRATPWGLNVPLFTVALLAAAAALLRWRRIAIPASSAWLIAPALLFAAAIAWRDSAWLFGLNLLALLGSLALIALYTRAGRLLVAGATEYLLGALLVGVSALAGWTPPLLADVRWPEVRVGGGAIRHLVAVTRGLAIALPLLLVFGALFVAADAAFEGLVGRLFDWDLATLLSHLFLIGCWAWLSAGWLRQMLLARPWANPVGACPRLLTLGMVEMAIVLGALDLLFLAFVILQLPYLFGGAARVQAIPGLTYSEYARRGFFELVTVAALALPVLLLADWALRRERAAAVRLFRLLAAALVALLFVVIASALQRMLLYQSEYGLTELRVYTTAFMLWLAVVVAWFLATVLPGRRDLFAIGALLAAMAVVLALDAANPDALITRVNLARLAQGRPFDAEYATVLSADAVPTLVESLPTLPERERRTVAAQLAARWSPPAELDWRTWSWGRQQAWRAVAASRAAIQEEAAKPR
jgi:hypothetical protein